MDLRRGACSGADKTRQMAAPAGKAAPTFFRRVMRSASTAPAGLGISVHIARFRFLTAAPSAILPQISQRKGTEYRRGLGENPARC